MDEWMNNNKYINEHTNKWMNGRTNKLQKERPNKPPLSSHAYHVPGMIPPLTPHYYQLPVEYPLYHTIAPTRLPAVSIR